MSQNKSIPPLIWLRSFEAAGRLRSFKLAAEEISVSGSTVSHQIRDLEQHIGVPLFVRGAQVTLTQEGQDYLKPISDGFSLLRGAIKRLETPSRELKVGAFPFVSNEVLAPHLQDIKKSLGISRLSLHTETHLDALRRPAPEERLDAIIRYSHNDYFPSLTSLKLFDISVVPIQSMRGPKFESVDQLMSQPIVKVLGPFDAWGAWKSAHQIQSNLSTNFVIETDSFHSAALAVERGDGICLGILPYMNPWISAGRIRALTEWSYQTEQAAYLVFGTHNQGNQLMQQLRDWLVEHLEG